MRDLCTVSGDRPRVLSIGPAVLVDGGFCGHGDKQRRWDVKGQRPL